eukprot:scaffold509_cov149-Skeletonema_dohrnii-CCMP3373.AAC.3
MPVTLTGVIFPKGKMCTRVRMSMRLLKLKCLRMEHGTVRLQRGSVNERLNVRKLTPYFEDE